jgi:hypothetical protein
MSEKTQFRIIKSVEGFYYIEYKTYQTTSVFMALAGNHFWIPLKESYLSFLLKREVRIRKFKTLEEAENFLNNSLDPFNEDEVVKLIEK